MKKITLFLLFLTMSCGYHIQKNSPCKVYVKRIDNLTSLAGFDFFISKNLDEYIYSYLSGKAKNGEGACAIIELKINAERARSIQSGSDNRSTVENRIVVLTAAITKGKDVKTYTQNFSMLNRYPTNSELYVDDTKQLMEELSKKMAFQVVSWITANQ